jgi:hypothetical protein
MMRINYTQLLYTIKGAIITLQIMPSFDPLPARGSKAERALARAEAIEIQIEKAEAEARENLSMEEKL